MASPNLVFDAGRHTVITHLVLFRFKPGLDAESDVILNVHMAMSQLPNEISQIRSWQHGFNLTMDSDAWDYGLTASFDDEQALQEYFDHPAHLEVLAMWSDLAELRFVDLPN